MMAYRESLAAKTQILSMIRTLVKDLTITNYPALLNVIPAEMENFYLIRDKVHYFRSHLVLNSLYYLGQDNILQLDHKCQALLAFYRSVGGETVPCLMIQYPQPHKAHRATFSFLQALFPEQSIEPNQKFYFIETDEGWLGCSQDDDRCIITFEHSRLETAQLFLQHLRREHE
jgi:hypothetical protein